MKYERVSCVHDRECVSRHVSFKAQILLIAPCEASAPRGNTKGTDESGTAGRYSSKLSYAASPRDTSRCTVCTHRIGSALGRYENIANKELTAQEASVSV
jgi:hypothetical protein